MAYPASNHDTHQHRALSISNRHTEAEQRSTPMRAELTVFVVSMFFAPVGILLHEAGHWLIAFFFGAHDPVIHASFTSWTGQMVTLPEFLALLSGPLVTLLITLVGALLLVRNNYHPLYWAMVMTGLRTVKNLLSLLTGTPPYDERIIETITGLPAGLLTAFEFTTAQALFIWATFYLLPRGRRFVLSIGAVGGFVVGTVVWLLLLGPLMLP